MTHDTLRSFAGWRPPTRWLGLAAVLLAVECAAMAVMGVMELASTRADRPIVGISTGLVFLVYAAALATAGNGVRRGRRWARSVAVFTQLLHLPIAYSFWSTATWWVSALIAGTAAVTLVAVLLPSSTRVFLAGAESDGEGDGQVTTPPESPAGATPRRR